MATQGEGMMERAEGILAGLGGADNVNSVEACITRLRVVVADPTKVDDVALVAAGALGVVHTGPIIQVVVGPSADALAPQVAQLLA